MSTPYGSKDYGFFLVGGYELIGAETNLDAERIAHLQKATPPGVAWPTFRFTGSREAILTQDGFFDATANQANAALCEVSGSAKVLCLGNQGNVLGRAMLCASGTWSEVYKRLLAGQTLHRATATYGVSGAVEDAVILKTLSAISADGNSESGSVDHTTDGTAAGGAITANSIAAASVVTCPKPHGLTSGEIVLIAGVSGSDPTINGERVVTVIDTLTYSVPVTVTTGGTGGTFRRASTAGGGAGYLQVKALSLGGHDNLTVTIRHKVTGGAFADLLTFTVVTAAPAGIRIPVAGPVNQHLAVSWDFTGSGSGPTATILVGFARG